MNIEGINLLSLSPGNITVEDSAQSLPDNTSIPESEYFTNALKEQRALLNKSKEQAELSGELQGNIGDEDTDPEAATLALTDVLKSLAPDITPDELMTAQNMSDAMALNGSSFAQPPPEAVKLNITEGENAASADFLQKETAMRPLTQDKQIFNFPYIGNADSAEKTLMSEKQSSIPGIEKGISGVNLDMIAVNKQIDVRTDIPAVTRPLAHPYWGKDLGEQILWLNNKAMSAAEIKLNPAHLGPISVRIDVNQDQASIIFTAQNREVKDAIEASIPKLREMLGAQQLSLINVNISQNSTPDQGQPHSQNFPQTPENHEQETEGVTGSAEINEPDRAIVSKGLLSLYA